ncbi:4'-phosphopantetheinyl transferase family protein [Sanguibacter suaedae]|uniref:4'-phosphopantetheinyl transferase superfamily protein n=1 Tax=Sanguibacter suaedae TaxID=2795737 RepID=A0A934I2V3_9MICO|nr:4'-phosphopantetheinyl transferase superfamily protein [Sanguibacter suaedae]MBI9114198.1 4'-phosphopantetheinyl transferase superfamily protein [Sanguibacter suaedae]
MRSVQDLLAGLIPPGAAACASAATVAHEQGGPAALPEEAGLVGPELSPRRFQSLLARDCARTALARIGVRPVAIPRGPTGAPVWPDGVVGSLTHTTGLQAAVVGPRSVYAGLGIDVEPCHRLRPGVARTFAAPVELAGAAEVLGDAGPLAVFCAKEAAFKAWFPSTGAWMSMTDVTVAFTPDGTFDVRVRARGASPDRATVLVGGRAAVRDGFVVAVAERVSRVLDSSSLGTVFHPASAAGPSQDLRGADVPASAS